MGEKPILTARLSTRTMDRLEDYAESEGTSKSEAADRMIKQGLDVHDSDMRLVPVKADGGFEQVVGDLQNDVGQLEESIQAEREQRQKEITSFYGILGLSLLWIGIVQLSAIPWPVVAGTGSIMLVAVLFGLSRITGWFE